MAKEHPMTERGWIEAECEWPGSRYHGTLPGPNGTRRACDHFHTSPVLALNCARHGFGKPPPPPPRRRASVRGRKPPSGQLDMLELDGHTQGDAPF